MIIIISMIDVTTSQKFNQVITTINPINIKLIKLIHMYFLGKKSGVKAINKSF